MLLLRSVSFTDWLMTSATLSFLHGILPYFLATISRHLCRYIVLRALRCTLIFKLAILECESLIRAYFLPKYLYIFATHEHNTTSGVDCWRKWDIFKARYPSKLTSHHPVVIISANTKISKHHANFGDAYKICNTLWNYFSRYNHPLSQKWIPLHTKLQSEWSKRVLSLGFCWYDQENGKINEDTM